jgi:intracellular multiplication protein IcmO
MTDKKMLFGLEFRGALICDNMQKRAYLTALVAKALRGRCGGIIVSRDAEELVKEATKKAATRLNTRQTYFLDCGFARTSGVSFNPFIYADCAGIAALLHSQMAGLSDGDPNGVFRRRAEKLIDVMAPVLEWLRDVKGLALTPNTIRDCFSLPSIFAIARETSLKFFEGEHIISQEINLHGEISHSLSFPVRDYLAGVPRYDPRHPPDSPANQTARKQHSFSLYYFTAQLATLYEFAGGMFKSTGSELDLKDVLRQRNMVVVNAPYFTETPWINEAFGKLLIASIHNAAIALADERFEEIAGELIDLVPSPFHAEPARPVFVIIDGFEANMDLQLRRVALAARGEKIHFAAAEAGEGPLWFERQSHKRLFLEIAQGHRGYAGSSQ